MNYEIRTQGGQTDAVQLKTICTEKTRQVHSVKNALQEYNRV